MEALARARAPEAEPRLFLEWQQPDRGRGVAWAFSVAVHIAGLFLLTAIPSRLLAPPPYRPQIVLTTPLVEPPRELTQKEPNRAKIGKEFTLENLLPTPRIQAPRGMHMPTLAAPAPAPIPEPPKVETSQPLLAQAPQVGSPGGIPQPPPPAIQPEERPKLAFENPGAPAPRRIDGLGRPAIKPPDTSVTEAVRGAVRRGGGGVTVGDLDLDQSGVGPGFNLPPSPGKTASALELLSDPAGVDFKPYLIRVLASVKRNWLTVMPESARMGRAGRVQIQFAIARNGYVPKLVIATGSGTDALDRAAVAGISASQPFPPFPTGFEGAQVRLQFTFLYNVR
jgi:TonB family protein